MASATETTPDAEGPGARLPVKAHLLASRELLVASLYNLAPLLDCALAAGLLSQDNYYEVKAEKTPPSCARKLLEVVHAQMDESGATCFLECLRRCKHHYPRLRTWLCPDTDIQRGPTERQLKAQFSVLCARLGHSVLPVSLALFSSGTLTQFELDQVQAAPTLYQQAQRLLSICLSKGESACTGFYVTLHDEDQQLAEEISVSSLVETLPDLPVESDPDVDSFPVAVEETRNTVGEGLPHPGVLQQVMAQLGMGPGDKVRLNVCELGVALGLPRRTVRECLLEEEGAGDTAQLGALVALFLKKTQDVTRLLSRVAECSIERVQLSERGGLLLKLLQEAEALLRCGNQLRPGDHLHAGEHRNKAIVWSIFSFLLWDCMAEALEAPVAEAWRGAVKSAQDLQGSERATLLQEREEWWRDAQEAHTAEPCRGAVASARMLRGSERVEAELLQELEECWKDGGAESLLQSVLVLAQVIRDLHPLQDRLQLSPPVEGVYSCRPRRLHRATSFQGLPAHVIRKALRTGMPVAVHPDPAPLSGQYGEVCLRMARLLDQVQPDGGVTDLSQAPVATITQHIHSTLSQAAFSSQAFDAGVKHRLLSVLEFDPAQLGLHSLMQLHQEALSGLARYLQPGEHHGFQFLLESVRVLGRAQLHFAGGIRGPVAIDDGLEEVLRFVTSEPTSFLVRLGCHGYEGRWRFEVREPRCVSVSRLEEQGVCEVQGVGGTVLAAETGSVWIREGGHRWREELQRVAQRHSAQLHEEGCCFKVTASGSECEVRLIYRSGRMWAVAERDCEVS